MSDKGMNKYVIGSKLRPSFIFNRPVLASIDWYLPVLSTAPENISIVHFFDNLDSKA